MKSESMTDHHAPHIKKHDHPRKVFDVMRPGRAPTGATSRPVIVGHGSHVQDPMVGHGSDHPRSHAKDREAKRVHVVEDAEKALHPPDEPLLLAHNPETAAAPAPRHFAASDHVADTTSPVIPHTERDPALDKEARDELAVMAVEGVTEFADAIAVDGHLPFNTETPQAENVQNTIPKTDDKPVQATQIPKNQTAKTLVTEDDILDLAEIGKDVEASVGAQPLAEAATVFENTSRPAWHMWLTACIVLLLIAAAVVDLLLDGGFIMLNHVPHTHIF